MIHTSAGTEEKVVAKEKLKEEEAVCISVLPFIRKSTAASNRTIFNFTLREGLFV